jgi:hypothetical protein
MKRALSLAVATLALVLASPAAAWVPQRLSPNGSENGALVTNERGDAAAVFVTSKALRLAVARPGRKFGPSEFVPGSNGARSPRLAIDESGNVVIVWSYFDESDPDPPSSRDEGCCLSARMTVRTAGSGHFRRVQNLAPEGRQLYPATPAIAHGRVAVAWGHGSRTYARFAPRGRRLERAGSVKGFDAVQAVLPTRRGARVTYTVNEAGSLAIREFHLGRLGQVTPARTLVAGLPFIAVDMATNARGDQAATWGGYTAPRYAAVRSNGGRFRVRRVGPSGDFVGESVAISPDGRAAIVAWTQRGRVRIASARHESRFGSARLFAGPPGYASNIRVAVNDSARAVVEWNVSLRVTGAYDVFAAFRAPGGRQFGRRRVAKGYTAPLSAAIDGRSRARVMWSDYTNVFAARGLFP